MAGENPACCVGSVHTDCFNHAWTIVKHAVCGHWLHHLVLQVKWLAYGQKPSRTIRRVSETRNFGVSPKRRPETRSQVSMYVRLLLFLWLRCVLATNVEHRFG